MSENHAKSNMVRKFELPHVYFTLQWHITARCQLACKHCYMTDSPTYESERANELGIEECLQIIDDFASTFGQLGIGLRINFTGGDPLLNKNIFKLIEYTTEKGILVGILGNANLLNEKNAAKLKDCGLSSYQVSLDGTEETHDYLRRRGSYQETINSIKIINSAGLESVVMMTVSSINVHQIIDVIRVVARNRVNVFDFARLVPVGAGKKLSDDLVPRHIYKRTLLKVLDEYLRLENIGCLTRFGRKDHLWKLLYQEIGLWEYDSEEKRGSLRGCAIGSQILTILADGTVLPCRRLPIVIGKVPEQRLSDIFINSRFLNEMRNLENYKKCSSCKIVEVCRGCPAVPFGATGDAFAPDPQCWTDL